MNPKEKCIKYIKYKTSRLLKRKNYKSFNVTSRKPRKNVTSIICKLLKKGIYEHFRKKHYISRSRKISMSVERSFHNLPKKRKIYLFRYVQEYSFKFLNLWLHRKNNKTEDLSESKNYILHFWRSVVRLKTCVNERKGMNVSKILKFSTLLI